MVSACARACRESWVVVEAQERAWQSSEMRLPNSACRHSVIRCRRRVGEVVGLLGHAASI